MKERAKEQNSNEDVSPDGAAWEFANVFTEISESKKDQLTTSAVDLGDFIKNVKEKGRKAANAFRNIRNKQTAVKIDAESQTSLKEMYKYIRGGMASVGAAIWDQETKKHVFDMAGQHAVMIREWKKVFDKHAADPPKWSKFEEEFGKFEKGTPGAPQNTPEADLLYSRAQRAKEDTSGGADGWSPTELKALPYAAWVSRAEILKLAGEIGSFPQAYRTVHMAAIGKADDSQEPLDHRLISLFSCLYRIEGGAWFELLAPWLKRALHPDVVGALADRESLETAWDAQGFLEEAMAKGTASVLSSYDFSKYFDSFEHGLTKEFLLHAGAPLILANLLHDLYKNMKRVMKRGKSLSEEFQGFNGFKEMCCLYYLHYCWCHSSLR
jgi:hypothetical protein